MKLITEEEKSWRVQEYRKRSKESLEEWEQPWQQDNFQLENLMIHFVVFEYYCEILTGNYSSKSQNIDMDKLFPLKREIWRN